ncbi:MAG: PQQ-like beta-propeller repeat protein [Myxococcales bacterium]|nr:PQQ-like beta-propeller repeat protein [Myxococcales bacterium]
MRTAAPVGAFVIMLLTACGGATPTRCELGTDCADGETCVDGRCVVSSTPDGGPTDCRLGRGCPSGSRCDDATGGCVADDCAAGTIRCQSGVLFRCEADMMRVLHTCPSARCDGDRCACDGGAACLDGESCEADSCVCESEQWCESPRICCGGDEVCFAGASCDAGGRCALVERCAPSCEGGTRCGEAGELCCSGETPVCGPANTCVPDCGAAMLCGEGFDTCCGEDELCSFGRCFPLGAACTRFTDCDFGEYCEPSLGRCVADEFPDDVTCRRPGDFGAFEPELRWHWDGVTIGGQRYVHVAATPMVADLTGDGSPNVAFLAYRTGGSSSAALVVLDGRTGETLYTNTRHAGLAWAQVALADVDADGLVEIVVPTASGIGLVENLSVCADPAADANGCFRWHRTGVRNEIAPVVADLRGDGDVQVIFDRRVFDARTGDPIAAIGSGSAYASVADLDGDGTLEILSHGCAYRLAATTLEQIWCTPGVSTADLGSYSALGDIVGGDRRGSPEVVWVGGGQVTVAAGNDGAVLHRWSAPGGGGGGPPTVADFDGDGHAEIGVADRGCYTVFDVDCVGDPDADQPGCTRPRIPTCTRGVDCTDVEPCPAFAGSGGSGNGVLWSVYVQDISSSRTGSSVFDFQGDGRNEVVYNDECLLMVFDGQSGAPIFRVANTTRTASEYPVIVDVTGDGQTNIVVAANNDEFNRDCARPMGLLAASGERIHRPDRYPECFAEPAGDRPEWCRTGTTGVFAYQDALDRWVRTRTVWNEFAYHIDNVRDDATIPSRPRGPWETHNTFRANRQGEVPLNASDPRVDALRVFVDACPREIIIDAVVSNRGTRAIPAGMPVSLYRTDGPTPTLVATLATPRTIFPGGALVLRFTYALGADDVGEPLAFRVVANDDGTGEGVDFDCNPSAAIRDLEGVQCPGLL